MQEALRAGEKTSSVLTIIRLFSSPNISFLSLLKIIANEILPLIQNSSVSVSFEQRTYLEADLKITSKSKQGDFPDVFTLNADWYFCKLICRHFVTD